jgi:THO complex subunit 2
MKKSITKLRDALLNSKLAIPLLILIGQQRSSIIFNTESVHLKLIGDLYDKCQETFLQYTEFLATSMSPQTYTSIVPSVLEFCTKFQLEPETAFHAVRPLLPLLYVCLVIYNS